MIFRQDHKKCLYTDFAHIWPWTGPDLWLSQEQDVFFSFFTYFQKYGLFIYSWKYTYAEYPASGNYDKYHP